MTKRRDAEPGESRGDSSPALGREMAEGGRRNRWLSTIGCLLTACVLATGCRPGGDAGGSPPRVVTEMNRGVSLMGQYLYDEAVSVFEGVVRTNPKLADARINLAIALFNRNRKEDLDAAGRELATVLQQEPGNLRALYFQAIVFQHIGKADLAVPCLERVVQARPDDGAAWYVLALCKQRLGQPAEKEFLKAVACKPYLYSAYYQLYQAAMRAGQEAQARQYMEKFKTLRESPLGETIELPQYNQMGDLALASPMPTTPNPPVARSLLSFGPTTMAASLSNAMPIAGSQTNATQATFAAADLDADGRVDLVLLPQAPGPPVLLRQAKDGSFKDATAGSGLEGVTNAIACAIGDFDNDERPDLCLTTANGVRLFRSGAGGFTEVTASAGIAPVSSGARSTLFLDADHDGDLDVLVCAGSANQLWNNNGDGTFTDIAAKAGVACTNGGSILALAADLDADRDMDLIILRDGGPARVFLNELLGHYQATNLQGLDIRGEAGAVLQDLNGDGLADVLALGGQPRRLQLWLGDGHGGFKADQNFAGVSQTIDTWGTPSGVRVVDVDLDGDLDAVVFGDAAHVLLNDGRGRFVVQTQTWKPAAGMTLSTLEAFDVTGDLVPDLLALGQSNGAQVLVAPGHLLPPSTALAVVPSGVRSRDGRTRSPASGYGVALTCRVGQREQRLLYTGQAGGSGQSLLPAVLGLGGAPGADYVAFAWPDGVAQVEAGLAAGQVHKVAELQRKISSCPVLFAWNGTRFEFVTDFAGVGGLGYFVAPGVSAPPQVEEHVKIEPGQLRPRDGFYELRVTEPMEETAYVDRLELLAVDHPVGVAVFPDERLALSGPAPTHELLVVGQPVFPVAATDPAGRDCTDRVLHVDRRYAYEPELDRRYVGFCRSQTLTLDFGDRLAAFGPGDRVVLCVQGSIEYPYSQTVYAASQSGVGWEPIHIEAQGTDGAWRTIMQDGGAPGGMARMMTVDLTGLIPSGTSKLRLRTNLEIFLDQVFLARVKSAADSGLAVRSVPLHDATLRYLGFPREYSPDGALPWIYNYDDRETSAPFHKLSGAYTRYGAVEPLLAEFDDQYVLVGPGDEIALRFRAEALPAVPPGQVRSFVLVSHAYCKDMDLYTATPQTLEPLPFKSMSRYPYPAGEKYPDTEEHRRYRGTYNTRRVD